MLLVVFPANIYMATHDVPLLGWPVPGWVHAIRLPLQFVLIGLVLWSTRDASKKATPDRSFHHTAR